MKKQIIRITFAIILIMGFGKANAQRVGNLSDEVFKTSEADFFGGMVIINWTAIINDIEDKYEYEVESSRDGINYQTIGIREGLVSIGDYETHYAFIDIAPYDGYSYYRIKCMYGGYVIKMTNVMKVLNNYTIDISQTTLHSVSNLN